MSRNDCHPSIAKLAAEMERGRLDRREFLRFATLLGMSATTAYALAGKVGGGPFIRPARAEMPRGGTLKIGMRVKEIAAPHTYAWIFDANIGRQVHGYIARARQDNITMPHLAESWEVSDDLKTWTFRVRNVKWHNGRDLTAEDFAWNIRQVLEPTVGSSVLGLMEGYLLSDEGDQKVLWDANAIEVVDSHTLRLNLKVPQVAVPEHLSQYMLPILDPEEGGSFGPGSNGTEAFDLVEHQVGVKAILRARTDYWGDGPYVDELQFIDLGDDPGAPLAALASQQIHGIYDADISLFEAASQIPHATIHETLTANTAVARVQVDREEFADPRVRKALRLAIDPQRVLELSHRDLGAVGEHHHVAPVHPDYARLPAMERNVEEAKRLLAEAGHPDGIDLEINCKRDPAWEIAAVQAMVEQWAEADIRVSINVMPSALFWDNWDTVPFGFTEWKHRTLGITILGLAYRTGVPWNESRYANPEFDEFLSQAEATLDVDQRREILGEIERIMQEDGPIVQPVWRSNFVAYDTKVKGFRLHPTGFIFGEELAIEA